MATYCPYCTSKIEQGARCPNCSHEGSYRPKPHHLMPGSLLNNRYLVGTVLGEGGFGITYQGRDLALDMKVAIKEYFPSAFAARTFEVSSTLSVRSETLQAPFADGKDRVIREARAMARMEKEDAVVTVRDYFEANNSAYIVMEYVQGKDLRMLLKERHEPLDSEELLKLLEPVFEALDHLHKQGLIHRDISPDNIMVENGAARLIDFGCTGSAVNAEGEHAALKHSFSPIEQYRSEGMGPWTDEYAMAATIYYCITGKLPPKVTDRLEKDTLQPPSVLGVKLKPQQEKALLRALSVKSEDRFPTMEEFGRQLFIHKKKKKKTAVIAAAVCAAAVAVAAAGAVLMLKSPEVVYTRQETTEETISVYSAADDIPAEMKEKIALLEAAVLDGMKVTDEHVNYYCTVEMNNGSGTDFDISSVRLTFMNGDTVLQSGYARCRRWEAGQTFTDRLYFGNGTVTEVRVQVTFEDGNARYETGELRLPFDSGGTVEFLNELPLQLTVGYTGKKSVFSIESIDYRIDSGSYLRLTISGEKISGAKNSGGYARVYLLSEDDEVLAESSFDMPEISAGERFEDYTSSYFLRYPGGRVKLKLVSER